MTVRLTPTESDGVPEPHAASAGSPEPHAGDPPSTSDAAHIEADGPDPGDSRRALRESRRQRRRTAWVCAVVVALCLALTIAVVTMARYRPIRAPGTVESVALVADLAPAQPARVDPHHPDLAPDGNPLSSESPRGAGASEGVIR